MKTILAPSLGLVLVLAGADAAFAKPKKPAQSLNGCTPGQYNSPSAQACWDKGAMDITNNRNYAHQVVCTISGVYCCKVANGTKAISGCTTISGKPAVNGRPASGGIPPGGSQAN